MDLNINDEVVRRAVSSAIIDELGMDGQRKLVEAALVFLTTPQKDHTFGRNPTSPIQEAFNRAVGDVARQIVTDLVANDPAFQERIKTSVGEAFLKMESTNFSDYLGSALSEALKR